MLQSCKGFANPQEVVALDEIRELRELDAYRDQPAGRRRYSASLQHAEPPAVVQSLDLPCRAAGGRPFLSRV